MSRGAPSSLALELVGLDGALVSREEVVQWNGSKNGFNLSASKQGIFQVRVTAYNRLGNITVMAGNITALYSVSILELKVTEHVSCPPGRATFWLKPREPAQVPSIIHYSAHFGDGETDSGEVFDLEISHDYRKIGRFTATIKLSNPVSTFVLSASLMILWHGEARGELCQSPSVTVSGGGSSAKVPTTYLSSESFVLSAAVSPDAVNASTLPFLHFEWQVAVASGDNLTDMELNSQTITNRSELLIPSSAFSPDVYRARFFAWAAEETEPVTSVAPQRIEIGQAEVFFKVVAAPLQATIEGGSVRRIGAGSEIIMDGSSSRDPDAGAVPSQLNYTWSCDKCPESCLDNRHRARLTLKDGCLTAGSEVIFRLTVSSTDKLSAQAEQRLVVLSGQVPDVSIQCIENCVSWVVPAKRLVLMAKCNNCTTQIYYYWSLRQDVGDQVRSAKEHLSCITVGQGH
uniref:PKD/REJ-like domain-containing protein n=1 Tax=Eptatretus burgeri TaxID=7764 RepID=A0A8C4N5C1_EPTBU